MLASSLDEGAKDLSELLPLIPESKPLAMVFGNEQRGTSRRMRVSADHCFVIPMRGFVESFNLSVSVGISLQTCALHKRLVPDLTEVRGEPTYDLTQHFSLHRRKSLNRRRAGCSVM